MKIIRASDRPYIKQIGGYKGSVVVAVFKQWGEGVTVNFAARGEPLPVEVNGGRWIVGCPYCRGALVMDEGETFYCPDCLMASNDGHARPVVWPDDMDEIERLLLLRPVPANRNWLPGETVEDLRAENIEHGCEV